MSENVQVTEYDTKLSVTSAFFVGSNYFSNHSQLISWIWPHFLWTRWSPANMRLSLIFSLYREVYSLVSDWKSSYVCELRHVSNIDWRYNVFEITYFLFIRKLTIFWPIFGTIPNFIAIVNQLHPRTYGQKVQIS